MSEQMREAFEDFIGKSPYEKSLVRYDNAPERAWPNQYRDITVQMAWECWQKALAPAEKLEPVAWLEHSLEGDVIGVTLHPDGTWPTTPLYAAPVDAHNYSIGLKL